MLQTNPELMKILAKRLKVSEPDRPNCFVEVDRLAFVAGRTERFNFTDAVSDKLPIEYDTSTVTEGGSSVITYGEFVFPVEGKSKEDINSAYGVPRGSGRIHRGVDVPTAKDFTSKILACMDGEVVSTNLDVSASQGKSVTIRHANNVVSKYFHLNSFTVKVGDTVTAGQQIGYAGNTGHVISRGVDLLNSSDRAKADAMRANGDGSHLHFEMWEKVPQGVSRMSYSQIPSMGATIDPELYMTGEKKAITSVSAGGTTATGTKDRVILSETFASRNWHKKECYSLKQHAQYYSVLSKFNTSYDKNNWLTFDFANIGGDVTGVENGTPITTGFDIHKTLATGCVLSMDLKTNFNSDHGDYMQVIAVTESEGDKVVGKFEDFTNMTETIPVQLTIPKGTQRISIEVHWGGKDKLGNIEHDYNVTHKMFAIHNLELTEVIEYTPPTEAVDIILDADLHEDIEVGDFVYSDTLRLDNIESCNLVTSVEQSCSTLSFVISNPDSYYSPDYNPANFPEQFQSSPFSEFINGVHVGVLGENTPIRVYMGYGYNTVRVFTGLIDRVDVSGNNATIKVTARDMFKRVEDTVLRDRKAYPEVDTYMDIFDTPEVDPATPIDDAYVQSVVDSAYINAEKWGVDELLLLAMCKHETQFGTLGVGVPSKGSLVLGYGKNTTDPSVYYGVDTQTHYGAKRIAEALASRGKTVKSLADVEYLCQGGDKGAYQWCGEGEFDGWTNNVWTIYKGYASNKTPPPKPSTDAVAVASTPQSAPVQLTDPETGEITDGLTPKSTTEVSEQWLKTAIVHDLLSYAGVVGWRATAEDLSYPDVVIEESYLIEADQKTGTVVKAVIGVEGAFTREPIRSVYAEEGWLNPFVSNPVEFPEYSIKIGDAVREVLKDTNYRVGCNRYGSIYVLPINLEDKTTNLHQISANDNLITISKTYNFTNARSHLRIVDEAGGSAHFIDKELLMELKGEIRTASVNVPWAKSKAQKREVAKRLFMDMKHLARTLQVAIVGNPMIDILDRVYVQDKNTSTRSEYVVKAHSMNYSAETGFISMLELTWADGKAVTEW